MRDSGALVKFALIPNNMVDRISVPSRRPALPAWHLPVFAGKSTPSLLACWPGPQFVSLSTRSCPPSHIFSSSSSTKWRRLRCWGSTILGHQPVFAFVFAYCLVGDSMLYCNINVFEASTYGFLIIRIIWNDLLELRGIMISDNTRFTKVAEAGRS